jgi:hypothetical protein
LCCGSQHATERERMGEFYVSVYYVMCWRVSFEDHRQGRIKGHFLQRATQA